MVIMWNRRRTKFCVKINHLVNILSFCLLLRSFQHVSGVSKSNYNSIHTGSDKNELGNYTFMKQTKISAFQFYSKGFCL